MTELELSQPLVAAPQRYIPCDIYKLLAVASGPFGGAFQKQGGGFASDEALVRHAEKNFWVRVERPRQLSFPNHQVFITRFWSTPAGLRKLQEVAYVL